MNPYLGEVRLVPFNFAPQGWALCDGSLLPISGDYVALFQLIGTTYGGNGVNSFALPNLQGRAALHTTGDYAMGATGGVENVTIDNTTMPSHSHLLDVNDAIGTSVAAASHYPAVSPDGLGYVYNQLPAVQMSANSVGITGAGQPHSNMQPFVVLNYIIALVGIFPNRG